MSNGEIIAVVQVVDFKMLTKCPVDLSNVSSFGGKMGPSRNTFALGFKYRLTPLNCYAEMYSG